ncbi:gamma-glutamyl-gamma-aminobutyrate hydrolase family protein [Lyngbya aestuarii]|uniref:gamma-glutamyl-gamma-aminobutyrate hydrolase family protein n=1 Tax=Lyngbya aestuarii TaxID=118322 RepID=UPI00403D6769
MTLTPPIIGIMSCKHQEYKHFYSPVGYAQAVQRSGGIPVLLPMVQQDPAVVMDIVDGIIFPGGGDLHPSLYNGVHHPTIYGVDSERDTSELAMARLALQLNKPLMGICRGLEVLMVASGGDLVSHVPEEFGEDVAHRLEQLIPSKHSVRILPGSRLAAIIGSPEAMVVSWHHQAVRTVPLGWRITAQAADGVIEALEHEEHPFAIALQWHPELSLVDPAHLGIFEAFIEAASLQKAAPCNF